MPVRAINAYADRYQRAAEDDPLLAWHFLNVTGFDEPTRTLFSPESVRLSPDSVRRMIGQSRRRRRKRALAATSA